MPLTLVTCPASAEKAKVVLDAYIAAVVREPLVVVPTLPDVERHRRELSTRGLVFGAQVLTQQGLSTELATRAGLTRRPLGDLARERIAAVAVGRTTLRVLGASVRTPGFLPAFLALAGQLLALRAAVGEMRARRLEPRPATCGWHNGGCTHPSVCRAEGL